jgi:hypothetical protein
LIALGRFPDAVQRAGDAPRPGRVTDDHCVAEELNDQLRPE